MSGEPASQARNDQRHKDYSRRRDALVGVRLSPDELAAVKAVAERDGLTLPGALREGFLQYAKEAV